MTLGVHPGAADELLGAALPTSDAAPNCLGGDTQLFKSSDFVASFLCRACFPVSGTGKGDDSSSTARQVDPSTRIETEPL